MLTRAQTQPVRDLLQAAEWHFDDDEKRLGSRKLWEAAASALSIIAEERGWPCATADDRFDIIHRLMAEASDPTCEWLDAGYLTALIHKDHADGGYREEIEFILTVPAGVDFVHQLLKIAEQPA